MLTGAQKQSIKELLQLLDTEVDLWKAKGANIKEIQTQLLPSYTKSKIALTNTIIEHLLKSNKKPSENFDDVAAQLEVEMKTIYEQMQKAKPNTKHQGTTTVASIAPVATPDATSAATTPPQRLSPTQQAIFNVGLNSVILGLRPDILNMLMISKVIGPITNFVLRPFAGDYTDSVRMGLQATAPFILPHVVPNVGTNLPYMEHYSLFKQYFNTAAYVGLTMYLTAYPLLKASVNTMRDEEFLEVAGDFFDLMHSGDVDPNKYPKSLATMTIGEMGSSLYQGSKNMLNWAWKTQAKSTKRVRFSENLVEFEKDSRSNDDLMADLLANGDDKAKLKAN